ncbi:MAG: prepilin-type N-terminal cleavage/methylation domain-containing protein [Proteobacteria bacterium]|nr:prepilin-type N-terminal cleavage/methylation domain-containing protein [Pseudomonadota bacterium]NOG61620.1 prepilin-type N-terminal cleavage/methylation domain-containing protein [Pseudomonadota bacterium]
MNTLNKHQFGFSLIELMVAMVIGLLLMSGAISLLMSNQRIYREQNEIGLLQENARFITELLHKDIRRSTFVGCVDDIEQVTNNLGGITDTSLRSFDISATTNLIEGSESGANWQPSNSADVVGTMLAGSDGITVRYLKSTGITLTASMASAADNINTDGIGSLVDGAYVAIGDCGGTDIFQVTTATGDSTAAVLTHPGLSRTYPAGSQIYILGTYRYGVGNSASGTSNSLWRMTPAGTEELAEGVENMQILYGEDTSNDGLADTFVDADTVADWSNVVAVKMAILMSTIDENSTNDVDTTPYSLLGTVVGPMNDQRRRRTFIQTIQIRNKRI